MKDKRLQFLSVCNRESYLFWLQKC